ncbi:hypothetical protein Ciccas_001329 [Cichlidogyrus casuarinus]|uniref:ascorbate ferrireductase (transmembrane) n=1 Tax=Cichlidogyrus casuarinus TaxID=1844966 RepID=A0ABD2QLJ7_9PLAT
MAVYLCSFIPLALILYFTAPWDNLFSWHPLLMSIGFLVFMLQANTIYNQDSSLFIKKSAVFKNRLHWILHLGGLLCFVVGFCVIYMNKNRNQKQHFATWHASFGIFAIACVSFQCMFGVVTKYNTKLKLILPHFKAKLYHATFGVLGFLAISLAFCLGLYSRWFQDRLAELLADSAGQYLASYLLLVVTCSLVYTLTNQVLQNYAKYLSKSQS